MQFLQHMHRRGNQKLKSQSGTGCGLIGPLCFSMRNFSSFQPLCFLVLFLLGSLLSSSLAHSQEREPATASSKDPVRYYYSFDFDQLYLAVVKGNSCDNLTGDIRIVRREGSSKRSFRDFLTRFFHRNEPMEGDKARFKKWMTQDHAFESRFRCVPDVKGLKRHLDSSGVNVRYDWLIFSSGLLLAEQKSEHSRTVYSGEGGFPEADAPLLGQRVVAVRKSYPCSDDGKYFCALLDFYSDAKTGVKGEPIISKGNEYRVFCWECKKKVLSPRELQDRIEFTVHSYFGFDDDFFFRGGHMFPEKAFASLTSSGQSEQEKERRAEIQEKLAFFLSLMED